MMRSRTSWRRIVLAGLAQFMLGLSSFAAELPNHPLVPGLERLRIGWEKTPSDDEDDAAEKLSVPRDAVIQGRILLGELNCLSCHAPADHLKPLISVKQAPILDHVAGRVKLDWIKAFLLDPQHAKPGSTMPEVLQSLSSSERTSAAEALVHFLAATGHTVDTFRDAAAAHRGQDLFHKVGCVACHDPQEGEAAHLSTSVPLPNLSQKYTSAGLAAFLKSTHDSRPSGRMPTFTLTDQQFRDLAHYLVKDVSIEPNVQFAAYHGSWDKIPDFSQLKPIAAGGIGGFDLSVAGRHDDFGARFQGKLKLEKVGKYTFHVNSDDGAKLSIDGKTVVDNDGIHPPQSKSNSLQLDAGWHDVIVDYIQGGGEATLVVEIEGSGLPRQSLDTLLTRETQTKAPQPAFIANPALARQGERFFTTLGCAACHALQRDGQRFLSQKVAKPLSDLKVDAGCLAESPPAHVPQYHLSAEQRGDIVAALQASAVESTAQKVHRLLLTFNCYACHVRNEWGGMEQSRNAWFQSLIQEMGDESRLPPLLTGVGDKLQDDWMTHLFTHGVSDRKNYMLVKMPKFGADNAGLLGPLFAELDRKPDSAPHPEFHEPEYRIKAAGRQLVGGAALSCIKCHDFREYPSTGIRATSLTTMTRRLREDWFYRYLLNPQEFRRGTRMPAPWPNGRAGITEVLHGDTPLQMRAVWTYLADGDKAAIPVGLLREPIELKPSDAPIIYRNFIEGAGNRAIAVGYPEQLNLVFDANEFRLAMIWHGAFLDASRHWTGRGQGTIGPLGDNLLELGKHPSFARLDSANVSWPTIPGREAGFQFLGYQLDKDQRPTFRYRFGDVTIADQPIPIAKLDEKYPTLKRILTISGPSTDKNLWYRVALAKSIADLGQGRFQIDGLWTLRLQSAEPPVIRTVNDQQELIIPVRLANNAALITQEYQW